MACSKAQAAVVHHFVCTETIMSESASRAEQQDRPKTAAHRILKEPVVDVALHGLMSDQRKRARASNMLQCQAPH